MKRFLWSLLAVLASTPAFAGSSFQGMDKSGNFLVAHFSGGGDVMVPPFSDTVSYYNSANQTVSTTGGSSVLFNPVLFDTKVSDPTLAMSSGVYTAKKAGYYYVEYCGAVQIGSAGAGLGNNVTINIDKNGSPVTDIQATQLTTLTPYSMSLVLPLAVGDTVKEVLQENANVNSSATFTLTDAIANIYFLRPL